MAQVRGIVQNLASTLCLVSIANAIKAILSRNADGRFTKMIHARDPSLPELSLGNGKVLKLLPGLTLTPVSTRDLLNE